MLSIFCYACHLYSFLDEVPIFLPVVLLLLSLKGYCIFWVTVFYQIRLLKILSPRLWLVFILLIVSFAEQTILILMRSNLSVDSSVSYHSSVRFCLTYFDDFILGSYLSRVSRFS